MRSAISDPSAMEPVLPAPNPRLADQALAFAREAGALGAQLHPITRDAVADLLRKINTYHSNLIEGHDTHPREIERALEGRFDASPEKRALQLEAVAHLEVQRSIEARLGADPRLRVTSPDFLRFLHREFYARLEPPLRTVRSADGREERTVTPGELRDAEVEVGRHLPPSAESLPRFLERFDEAYDLARLHGTEAIVAIAASHHRLLWIHPFLDGNGRVARLFTDACLRRVDLGGHGLWTASRGLARGRARYLERLAAADAERWNDYDGRGARSEAALVAFCEFFIDACRDQVRFMGSLLELDGLLARIEDYVARRASGGMGGVKLPKPARHLLTEVVLRGEVARGEAARITGTSERTARRILGLLVGEKLLVSETPKGPVRLGLPSVASEFLFPQLAPELPAREVRGHEAGLRFRDRAGKPSKRSSRDRGGSP